MIENVNPDYVFIECREEIFETYGALDGPQEFQFIYAYCMDHNIQVELIDWYLTDDEAITKTNSTSDERDNQIFYNIYDKMEQVRLGKAGTDQCSRLFYQQIRSISISGKHAADSSKLY